MAPILRKIAAFFRGSSFGSKDEKRPSRSPSLSSGEGSAKASAKVLVRLKSWFERTNKQAPEGYFSVDVGSGKIRYVVPIDYLSHVGLQKLLDKSVEEFGHSYVGALQLACEEDELLEVLNSIDAAVHGQGIHSQEERQHLVALQENNGENKNHKLQKLVWTSG